MTETFRCGPYVTQQISRLLGDNPAALRPTSRAALAKLRQAAAREPGTSPDVWALTSEGIPDGLPEARLRRVENAIHVALTQFAIHQQARATAMHDSRVPFGLAVRRLAQATARDAKVHETPVYRRFTSMSLARSLPALVAHARGIITQLRGHEIAFDYGRFADDLYWFQVPGRAASVQRRWGRDFHHLKATDDTDALDLPTGSDNPKNEGDS